MELAGIDPTEWNPQKGFAADRESVELETPFGNGCRNARLLPTESRSSALGQLLVAPHNVEFAANRESIERVYYERLYGEHAELRWAGMAKLAGGVVWGALEHANLGMMGAMGT